MFLDEVASSQNDGKNPAKEFMVVGISSYFTLSLVAFSLSLVMNNSSYSCYLVGNLFALLITETGSRNREESLQHIKDLAIIDAIVLGISFFTKAPIRYTTLLALIPAIDALINLDEAAKKFEQKNRSPKR